MFHHYFLKFFFHFMKVFGIFGYFLCSLLLEVDVTMHILFVCLFSDGIIISFWCSFSVFFSWLYVSLLFVGCVTSLWFFCLVYFVQTCFSFSFYLCKLCSFCFFLHIVLCWFWCSFWCFCNNFYAFALRFF